MEEIWTAAKMYCMHTDYTQTHRHIDTHTHKPHTHKHIYTYAHRHTHTHTYTLTRTPHIHTHKPSRLPESYKKETRQETIETEWKQHRRIRNFKAAPLSMLLVYITSLKLNFCFPE